jgi:hypothetical protein
MRINRDILPAKYVLEVYKMVEGYPSTIDLLYEVTSILEERDKLTESFTAVSMLKEVSIRFDGEDLEDSLKRLASEGWLQEEDGKYTLIKHLWMSKTN